MGCCDDRQEMLVMIALLAYFDPGSGSLLLQALLGGSAGLLVFAKYVWDSLRARQPDEAAARE
jgi:hypothetical protein